MHVARVAAQVAADVEDGDEAAGRVRCVCAGLLRRGPRVRRQGQLARPEQAAADVVLLPERLADGVVGARFLVGCVRGAQGLHERDLGHEGVQRGCFVERGRGRHWLGLCTCVCRWDEFHR